jgi:RNA polymerase sigma-70 factor (ECF subfamily)
MEHRKAEFEALAVPHLDDAYALARWLSRSAVDAEDIVQEAMLRAFRAFDGRRIDAVRPWLMAIVRNCFHDQAARTRAQDRRRDDGARELALAEAPTPEAVAVWRDERRRLDKMLGLLPPEHREVLVLRELQDLSYREIAEVIGAPIGTVMSRLARARALLKAHWLAEAAL